MNTTIKSGSLSEFFAAAKQTARTIDQDKPLTPQHTVWLEAEDLTVLLKPQRTALLRYLRELDEINAIPPPSPHPAE